MKFFHKRIEGCSHNQVTSEVEAAADSYNSLETYKQGVLITAGALIAISGAVRSALCADASCSQNDRSVGGYPAFVEAVISVASAILLQIISWRQKVYSTTIAAQAPQCHDLTIRVSSHGVCGTIEHTEVQRSSWCSIM